MIDSQKCTCPMECDCEDPDREGVALVSNECPEHNWKPRPAPDCPVHSGESSTLPTVTKGDITIDATLSCPGCEFCGLHHAAGMNTLCRKTKGCLCQGQPAVLALRRTAQRLVDVCEMEGYCLICTAAQKGGHIPGCPVPEIEQLLKGAS